MGYNNNHAGMHMISHRKYGGLDNLEYYDKIVEEKVRNEREKREALAIKTKTKEEKATPPVMKIKKKKSQDVDMTLHMPIKYGTEKTIDVQYFSNMNLVSKNVMLMAIRQGKDVRKAIRETEELMKKDFRTNIKWSMSSEWSWLPVLEKSMVFLSILADKLVCSVQDFFTDDASACKRLVYKLLESTKDSAWDSGFVSSVSGEAEIVSRFYDEYCGWTKRITTCDFFDGGMNLTLRKEKVGEKAVYSLSYGSLQMKPLTAFDYMLEGACLWEEVEGMLKDTMERLIQAHTEWLDNDEYCVI